MTEATPVATRASRDAKVRVVIFAGRETAKSIPEFAAVFGNRMDDRFRAGFGATASLPLCGGNEANIADGFGDMGLARVDPTFRS